MNCYCFLKNDRKKVETNESSLLGQSRGLLFLLYVLGGF